MSEQLPRAPDALDAASGATPLGPWNPGIESPLPERLRHLCTIFRPENGGTPLARARELGDITGLPLSELATFQPRRLALHELLVRVTADLTVPDGPRIEDLGINFRRIVSRVFSHYIEPDMAAIATACEGARGRLASIIKAEVAVLAASPSEAAEAARWKPKAGWLRRLSAARAQRPVVESQPGWERRWIDECKGRAQLADDAAQRAALNALATLATALLVQHGRIWGGRDMIASIAADLAWNEFGSEAIGSMIESSLETAVRAEGYRLLPTQAQPVVMNTKGPSASGKSTLRPLQRTLAGDLGVDWGDFALISPDIWRKQLLDYASLGAHFRYGGALTADEVQIVDQKLDRYMARKARSGRMSHLLIDRFRFDSFAPDSHEAGSNLLTRFGHFIYLFFMITPPESARRARLEARPGSRTLQGRRRHARPCRRGVLGHAAAVLHLAAAQR